MLVKEFLRPSPITTIEADNGRKAVDLSREHKPDVILLDLKMPVLGGIDAMKEIRKDEQTREIPVIALTASSMKGEKERMINLGFSGYMTKPIRKATLYQELVRFIPHTKEIMETQSDPSVELGEIDMELLPKVVDQLENIYMRKWKIAKKNQVFDEIGDFADHIKALGERRKVDILKNYGENLGAYVTNFDVENMNTTLNDYPKMVEDIKSLYAPSH